MRKIFYAAILILFCAIDAHAQGGAFGDVVFGPNIAIKPGASVTICTHPSTVASCPANKITLYSDINLSVPVTNPLTTDGEGHWLAYAPSGTYDYIVTGSGITPMTAPFTFSIGGSGGACSTVLQTNGTPNTDQCLLNLHQGTNITISNTAGTTTINATGGGTGCTLPGNDTGVLSEHPTNTCYNSVNYTWDDSLTNFQAGDGTNTVGGSDTFNLGESNLLATGAPTESAVIGDFNTLSYGNEKYAIGSLNHLVGTSGHVVSDSFAIGENNTIDSNGFGTLLGTDVVLGFANSIRAQDCEILGEDNTVSQESTGGHYSVCGILGEDNNLVFSGAANNINPANIYLMGDDNTLTETASQVSPMVEVRIMGSSNTVTDSANYVDEVSIVGDSNDVDGANSTVQVLGYKNSITNATIGAGLGNTTVVGSANTVASTGATVGSYASVTGANITEENCSNCHMYGANGIDNGTSNLVTLGISTTPEEQITAGLITLNAPEAILVANAGSTGTTLNKLAKFTGAPSTAVITSTSDVSGAIGIVSLHAGTTGTASISKLGITLCVFDGATTAGDYVNISTSTAGDCHDAGAGQPLYSIGRVMSTNGGGGTYPVDLIIGAGTGGAIATQGKVALTGQTTSLSPATLITTPASPALAAYRVTAALSCDASSASATVTFTLAWTDPSSTSQSITSSAATCTTLGSASYQSLAYAINVKEGTAINYSTTIANTPTYSLHVLLEGAW